MERYESDYSDDFEEEELRSAAAASSKPSAGSLYVGGGRPPQRRKRREQPALQETRGRRGGEDRYGEEKFITPSRQRGLADPPPSKSRSTGAVSTTRRRGLADQQSSRRSFLPRKLEPVGKASSTGASPARDRQLSAMNHKVRGLQNRLAERERQLEEVSRENRLLTRLQKKQDKEWTRIQRQEDELPHILSRHEQEVKSLRQQLRKSHDQVLAGQRKLGELGDEVRRLSEANHKLEEVVGRTRLLERDRLTDQLQQVAGKLAEKEKRVADLERGFETSGKTHAQEVKGLRARNRALASEAASLRDNVENLLSRLKEKTREMEVMNIYTQRIPRSLQRPSPPPTPALPSITHQSSQTTISCPPFKSVSMQHRSQMKTAASQTEVASLSHTTDSSTQTVAPEISPAAATNQPSMTIIHTEAKGEKQTPQIEKTGVLHGVGEKSTTFEAQRSKEELLQRLRMLDGQKTGNPLSPSTVRTSAPPTSQPVNPTPPAIPHSEPPPTEVDAREQERKRLLLAKLMAIEEGGDPNHVKSVPQQNARGANSVGTPANKGSSNVSLNSWPDVVENMHQGRPAHASEDDPFGSQSRLSGRRREGGRRGGSGVREEVTLEQNTFLTEPGKALTQGDERKTGYKPSFGRRATRPNYTDSTPNHKPHPPLGEASENFIPEASPSISRGGLLPRRPKADATAMRSHDVMPGAVISEPDDIEELVL